MGFKSVGITLILRVIRERDPGTQIASVPDAPRLWRLFKGLGHGLIQKLVLYEGAALTQKPVLKQICSSTGRIDFRLFVAHKIIFI